MCRTSKDNSSRAEIRPDPAGDVCLEIEIAIEIVFSRRAWLFLFRADPDPDADFDFLSGRRMLLRRTPEIIDAA
jgi:hypothetical protein